ncbi:MAG: hypothetical protein U9Q39_05905, partial [Pseudomonadota bacterium]|nr:hypothetical protein [Pseudomonadota bacterium]
MSYINLEVCAHQKKTYLQPLKLLFNRQFHIKKITTKNIYHTLQHRYRKYLADHHKVTARGVERRFALLRTGTELNSVPTSRQFEIKAEYL